MPGPILPAPAALPPFLPAPWPRPARLGRRVLGMVWLWDRTGWTALTAQVEEQEQGELQQEGCPSTAPGHGLLRGFGITWNGESGLFGGSARAGDEVG